MKREREKVCRVPAINETHNSYISLAFVAMRRTIPQHIRRELRERGLHQDLEQEISIIAYEGMQLYPLEGNDYLNFAGRRLYRFLRQNGYRRPRGHNSYVREEIGMLGGSTVSYIDTILALEEMELEEE